LENPVEFEEPTGVWLIKAKGFAESKQFKLIVENRSFAFAQDDKDGSVFLTPTQSGFKTLTGLVLSPDTPKSIDSERSCTLENPVEFKEPTGVWLQKQRD